MDYKQSQSKMNEMAKQIRLKDIGLVALLLCNVLLGSLLWYQSGRQTLVLIPQHLSKKATISPYNVSSTYLEAVALTIVNERLNVTPETIKGSNQEILNYVDSQFYAQFEEKLSKDADSIIKGKISSTYYVTNISTDSRDLLVKVQGKLKRWVGFRTIGEDIKSYELRFSKKGDLLLLQSFKEVKKD